MKLLCSIIVQLFYLNLHFISSMVLKFICNFEGGNFVRLLNSFIFFKNNNVRFYYDNCLKIYFYRDLLINRDVYFSNRYRALKYISGIKARSDALAKDYFLDLINFEVGDKIIDCGANIGEVAFYFDFKDLDIFYIAFEPSYSEFICLRKNVYKNKFYNNALWIDEGEIEFFISSNKADSSIIRPVNFTDIVKIRSVKLSSIIQNKVKLLKLEAEGAEPEILMGAEDKLSLVEYISADLGPERGVECESTMVPVVNYLLEREFIMLAYNHSRGTALFKNKKHLGKT